MALNPAAPLSTNAMQEANLLHSPQSPESKERVKWEAQHSLYGPGLRPYVKRDYPMMMYLFGRPKDEFGNHKAGPDTIVEQEIVDAPGGYEDSLRSRGFRETPLDAMAHFEGEQLEHAKLAANLEYQKTHTLSARAAAEVEAAQDAHPTHLPMVPVTPIKPRAKERE